MKTHAKDGCSKGRNDADNEPDNDVRIECCAEGHPERNAGCLHPTDSYPTPHAMRDRLAKLCPTAPPMKPQRMAARPAPRVVLSAAANRRTTAFQRTAVLRRAAAGAIVVLMALVTRPNFATATASTNPAPPQPQNTCATNIEVQNLNATGPGSLRQAIADACPGATITFAAGLTNQNSITTLSLGNTGALEIYKPLTIQGPGRDKLAITRDIASGPYTPRNYRTIVIGAPTTTTITGITINNKNLSDTGAIYTTSSLVLRGCRVENYNNRYLQGGALACELENREDILEVVGCEFINNRAQWSWPFYGSGVGSALTSWGRGVTIIQDTVFTKNEPGFHGGGAIVVGGKEVRIIRCTFDSNNNTSELGGIPFAEWGGAIWWFADSGIIDQCLITNHNTAEVGGAIAVSEPRTQLRIVNSTISNNGAQSAIFVSEGVVEIENTTLDRNVPSWPYPYGYSVLYVYTWPGYQEWEVKRGKINIKGCLFSRNGSLYDGWDSNRSLVSLGHNLIDSVGESPFLSNTTGDHYGDPLGTTTPNTGALESATTISALLGPLADNGGPTKTHALLPGSPAINTGDPLTTLTVDQRGFPRPAGAGFDKGAYESDAGVLWVEQSFTYNNLTPPGSTSGWSSIGFNSALGSAAHSAADGAIRLNIAAHPSLNRVAGVSSNASERLPYSVAGADKIVRGRFYVFAGGQTNPADVNQIPNMRFRLSTRYAVNAMLEVFHHASGEGDAAQRARLAELRPSTTATSPSLYRVDFDQIDIPYLAANAASQGTSRGAEAYAIDPTDHGYIALTESSLETYNTSLLSTATAPLRTYAPTSSDAGALARINPGELNLFNIAPGTTEGDWGTIETTGDLPTHSESAQGLTLATLVVPTNRIGAAVREISIDGSATIDYPTRPRVSEGKQYVIRWHLRSEQDTNRQAQIRLRARSNKFGWSQKLEIGGAWGTGTGAANPNNAIAQQSLPGVGTQNPDQRVGGEAGGWYTSILLSPLDSKIRSEFPAGTPASTTMPNLSAQGGPGADVFSRRDLSLGIDILDTLSAGTERFLEQGLVTADEIQIREYPVVGD